MKRKRTVLGFGMATSALLAAFLVTPVTAAGRGRSGAPDVPPRADGSWMAEVQRNIEAQEYEVTWQDRTVLPGLDRVWQAPNRAQGFRTYFTEAGIRVIPRTEEEPLWEWGLDLVGYGRGNLVWPVPAAALRPSGNRIEYARGAIEEWYANEPKGLEQGFRLDARPEELAAVSGAPGGAVEAGPRGSAVFVQLALKGTLAPVFSTDRQAIDFRAAGGAGFVRYSELRVTDAGGRELRAWMEAFAEAGVRGIRIVFDDTDAAYPVTIDPLATSPAWTAEGDQAYANFGASVATAGDVDGDGYSDVVVGAPSYDNGQADEGRAYVYRGSAAGLSATPAWTAESDQASAFFGLWVSTAGDVNGDGYSDVIVGAPCYDNGQADEGRAYVYHGSAAGVSGSPAWVA